MYDLYDLASVPGGRRVQPAWSVGIAEVSWVGPVLYRSAQRLRMPGDKI